MTNYSGVDNLEVMKEAKNYNKFLVNLILADTKAGECIVDFGAGAGTFAKPLTDLGYNLVCIEPDASLGALLRTLGVTVVPDLSSLPDASVDYLYTLNVLEHIEDDVGAVRQMYTKLKPGARLLIYVPAFDVLFTSMDRKVGHFRRYRGKMLVNLVRKAGLVVIDAKYVDSLGFFVALLYRLLDNGSGSINPKMLNIYDQLVFPVSRLLDVLNGHSFGKNLVLRAIRSQN